MTREERIKYINDKLDEMDGKEKVLVEEITKCITDNKAALDTIDRYFEKTLLDKLESRQYEGVFRLTEGQIMLIDKQNHIPLFRLHYKPEISFPTKTYIPPQKRIEFLERISNGLGKAIDDVLGTIYVEI